MTTLPQTSTAPVPTLMEYHQNRMEHAVASTPDILTIMDNKILEMFDEYCERDERLRKMIETGGGVDALGEEMELQDIINERRLIQTRILELKDSIAKGAGKTPQVAVQVNNGPSKNDLLALLQGTAKRPDIKEEAKQVEIDIDDIGSRGASEEINTIIKADVPDDPSLGGE